MSNLNEKAKEYLKADLSVIPTKEDKLPALPTWKPYQSQRIKEEEVDSLFSGSNVKGLAIICGAISGNLEVIDVDIKYDTTGTLWDEFRGLIEDNLPDLYTRLVIAETKNKGYHIYYRCDTIAGNLKLSTKVTKEVLIETRGEGGYVVAPPSPGYNYIQGDPSNIATITPEEREILFNIAKSFNELEEIKQKEVTIDKKNTSTGISPFEDYNKNGDVVALLVSNGWKKVDTKGERINLLRPPGPGGKNTEARASGNFHTGKRTLYVFSSSTDFEPGKGISPSDVFKILECKGDPKLAYHKLLELGYGEPYYTEEKTSSKDIKLEKIEVTIVNKINRDTSVIFTPGENINVRNVKKAIGDEVVITSPGPEAQEEILRTIALLQETGKRIYIKEGETEIREYTYQLQALFNKYGKLQEIEGQLTDRDKHNFLDEIIITSLQYQPLDRDIFLKDFLSQEAIKELGISEESLAITVDRLTSTRDKEAQAKDFEKMISEATRYHELGQTDKALEVILSTGKDVKLKDKATEFSSLMIPVKEAEVKKRQANRPESLNSGYTIKDEELLLPAGAITILSAPTSHGKTTFLINLALNVATAYPDKEAYLFSYEEDGDTILMNALNTYLNEDISYNNRRSLKSYFATESTEYIKPTSIDSFIDKKDKFFSEFIDTGRLNIHYTDYNSETLIDAIRYLHKNAKPGAIFIDYIQLLKLPEGKYKGYNSRQEEIKQICLALKDVAVETGLPIILGAQFNRTVVSHLNIHATNIGEAGDIERIANCILGFWNNNFKPIAGANELKEIQEKGCAENTLYVKVLKGRGIKPGAEDILSFKGNTAKIENEETSRSSRVDYFNDPKERLLKEIKTTSKKNRIPITEKFIDSQSSARGSSEEDINYVKSILLGKK